MLEKKRHLRMSIQIMLTAIIPISAFVAVGTEDTYLCAISATIMIVGLILMNKYGD